MNMMIEAVAIIGGILITGLPLLSIFTTARRKYQHAR